MNLFLDYTDKQIDSAKIQISGSKSESNRLLILRQVYSNLKLENVSDSDDSKYLMSALQANKELIDIGHAGTAMRFLTAYFAAKEGRETVLTGSDRMQNRPIKILVEALRKLGADIQYIDKEGYPPLRIKGKKLTKDTVQINGNVSSQYISALLLMAPSLENGLEIELLGEITSRPYLEMTLTLLKELGISYNFERNIIKVLPKKTIDDTTIVVESDWSSASYYYSLIALSGVGATVELFSYKKESLQGDSCLADIYKFLGVETSYGKNSIILKKTNVILTPSTRGEVSLDLDLRNAPDIAQTIAVSCFGLGIACNLKGLHTLKIKETDRLVALDNELTKLGAEISVTDESLYLKAASNIHKNISIPTYHDHRMAMAFAPLALKVPITIEEADVVTKSYTSFWEDFERCFFI
jgi:3-phosphoshikimate 1-carboxyvinyltransferase